MKEIKLGEVFDSYEEFLETLHIYSSKEYVSFYKREARTIAAAKKKTERYLSPKLKYYQLKYACIKGGKEFKSSGNGKRNTSTYKEGCNAHITLRASQCGTKLQIVSTENNHNHEISKQLYDRLPQQRRLPDDIQSEIIQLAKLKTKRKQIKNYVEEKCKKVVLLRDIHNIARKSEACEATLQGSFEKLQTKYGADCHILADRDNFKALFFQTKIMKHYMSVYPEFICFDTTFRLLDTTTPVLIIVMNEDGNGLSEIIAVGLLVEQSTDTMQWFISKFKETNSSWVEVKSIMADKDLNERRLLAENFPKANISICIFHAMKTFSREISVNKLGITLAERQTALEIFQKMVCSRDLFTYTTLYEDILKQTPLPVIEYFNKNWHGTKDEWALGSKFQQSNFFNTTNNRLESLNVKIKSLVERYSTLTHFIDNLLRFVMVMNDERDHKAANLMYKFPVGVYEKDSVLDKYLRFLTNYAFEFVEDQFLNRNLISNNSSHETTTESCDCGFNTSMILPCSHIFRKLEELGTNMYDESLCCVRWTRKHYYSTSRRLFSKEDDPFREQDYGPVTLKQHQKFNKAWTLLKSLASLISEEGNARYHAKLRQLIQLKTAWENNTDVTIVEKKQEIDYQENMDCVPEDLIQSLINQNNLISDDIIFETVHITETVNCKVEIADNMSEDIDSNPTSGMFSNAANTVENDVDVLNVSKNVTLPNTATKRKGWTKGGHNSSIELQRKKKK